MCYLRTAVVNMKTFGISEFCWQYLGNPKSYRNSTGGKIANFLENFWISASVTQGRKRRCQAGQKGRHLYLGAQRALRLLITYKFSLQVSKSSKCKIQRQGQERRAEGAKSETQPRCAAQKLLCLCFWERYLHGSMCQT